MKSSLTRSTAAGRAYFDLQRLAQRTGQLTNEILQSYILEGFLARLSVSKYSSQLVLKGGVLLGAYELRRPTRDIDIQAAQMNNSLDEVAQIISHIASLPREDGIDFEMKSIRAAVIREEDAYSGVRVRIDSRLATAKLPLHVDVNVGDPIWPPPQPVDLPALLGGTIKLIGYPIPMILAEKIVTVVQRGTRNTRWRDFADVHQLIRRHVVTGDDLHGACREVSSYREVALVPLGTLLEGFASQSAIQWAGWRRRQRRDELPPDFAEVVAAVTAFADPVFRGDADGMSWSPSSLRWVRG